MRRHLPAPAHHIPVRLALLLDTLGGPGSVRNARAASTALHRRHVEREEVEIFLRERG